MWPWVLLSVSTGQHFLAEDGGWRRTPPPKCRHKIRQAPPTAAPNVLVVDAVPVKKHRSHLRSGSDVATDAWWPGAPHSASSDQGRPSTRAARAATSLVGQQPVTANTVVRTDPHRGENAPVLISRRKSWAAKRPSPSCSGGVLESGGHRKPRRPEPKAAGRSAWHLPRSNSELVDT